MTNASSPKKEYAEPLVSVICRTTNRSLLVEAIASVANQNYRPIEIILVDATGEGVQEQALPITDIPINIVYF
jgi:hypothetical protein